MAELQLANASSGLLLLVPLVQSLQCGFLRMPRIELEGDPFLALWGGPKFLFGTTQLNS
jgi:hypothetical protein